MNVLETFQPLMAIATTPKAANLLQPLCSGTDTKIWTPEVWDDIPNLQAYEGSLKEHLTSHWSKQRAIVICLAMGAVVRLVSNLVTHKDDDPAVVVVDANGQFVISFCGGHRQGADQLTQGIAALLNAQPVITGASASESWPGLDTLGLPFGWQRNLGDWTEVSSKVAQGQSVRLIQTAGSSLWQKMLPQDHPLSETSQATLQDDAVAVMTVGCDIDSSSSLPQVSWFPKVLWVGIGCERGTSAKVIDAGIQAVLSERCLSVDAIAGISSVELKQDETGLLEVCHQNQWPVQFFPAEALANVEVPNPSDIVRQVVQTPSVCEAAAIYSAQQQDGELSPSPLRVQKTVHRLPGEPGAVTVAIAQSQREWIGKTGHLSLIGCGPGNLDQMTPAAQTALTQVDVVIGYKLYIDLVRSRLRPGQIIEGSQITQERARAQRAIDLANWGLSVAVISSGDSGIYGMAGLVMEELETQGWDGRAPSVQIFPGISALQAAASRVGTPLMHDFCAISLSDLLTPWDVIETRLKAAAAADFITALYNPKSKTRQTQLTQAQEIFLAPRPPETPVAIVKSAYRQDEFRQCSTLGKLHELDVDMLTLVLIGNQSTRLYENWMITPRGYLGFR